jgi:hypothetical protein
MSVILHGDGLHKLYVGTAVGGQVNMKKVIRKILLNNVSLIPAANNEIIYSMMRINFHNMPQDRLAADLNHRLWLQIRFFRNTGTQTTSKNDDFHFFYLKISVIDSIM